MTKIIRILFKWAGAIAGVIVALILADMAILSTPGLFFSGKKQYESITVYNEKPVGQQTDSIMSEVLLRLHEVPIYNPVKKYDLCLCTSQKKFDFFANLTVRANRIMGFNFLGNAYVNEEFIKELGRKTGGQPRYLTREGSVVHVATHELMHIYITDACGYFAARTLPQWKTEGYCEYGVNQFVAPRDSGYSIIERIDIYLDDSRWNPAAEAHRPHYVWGLMMEYLINVRGLKFKQVMADSVTHDKTYQEMMDWRTLLKRANNSRI